MLPWIHLATATAPQRGTLGLLRWGSEFSIRLQGGNELMNGRLGGSEEALSTLALARVADRPAPRVLIGGLGMGFTLRAAQAVAPPDARLIILEIVPDLVGWAGRHMAAVFGECLSGSRVEVRTGDVGAAICEAAGAFDAILLDVDNGPDGLTRAYNDLLYRERRSAIGASGAGSWGRPRRLVRRAGPRVLETAFTVRVRRHHAYGPRRPCKERGPSYELDRGSNGVRVRLMGVTELLGILRHQIEARQAHSPASRR